MYLIGKKNLLLNNLNCKLAYDYEFKLIILKNLFTIVIIIIVRSFEFSDPYLNTYTYLNYVEIKKTKSLVIEY